MELPDADLKISASGKWQHFQNDFFYRLVGWQKENTMDTLTRDEAFQLTAAKLRDVQDDALLILRGHLLIEVFLWQFLERKVPNPRHLAKSRLSFAQLLSVTASMTCSERHSWLWPCLRALNSLRNELSHNIIPAKFESKLDAFIRSTQPHVHTGAFPRTRELCEILIILAGIVFNFENYRTTQQSPIIS